MTGEGFAYHVKCITTGICGVLYMMAQGKRLSYEFKVTIGIYL